MDNNRTLRLKRLCIDTYRESILYMREDCPVCRAEGFEMPARIVVGKGEKQLLATLHIIKSELLAPGEASLSEHAWTELGVTEGDRITVSHQQPLASLSYVRSKVYGHTLTRTELQAIIDDIVGERYRDIDIATFLTACVGAELSTQEVIDLTQAMIAVGDRLQWSSPHVVDKHCVGGLPGNRTSLIIVPIVAAFGLTMPKTSSRAITSPAGTADTMEVLAPVDLTLKAIRKVVEQEQGCIVWGGSVGLSPADDILIRVERALDLDTKGQLVASVLSKKIAAGSSHIVIDIPVGDTAKVRSAEMAHQLQSFFRDVAQSLNIKLVTLLTDGSQPVGRGIGPVLEARDVLAVLQNQSDAPQDLRERALELAGHILEFSDRVAVGDGYQEAERLLRSGDAWKKFQAICQAQGGLREPVLAKYTHPITASHSGIVKRIDNRLLARIAKLAGAPRDKGAGIDLHVKLHELVARDQPLLTLYAESKGELQYALSLLETGAELMRIES